MKTPILALTALFAVQLVAPLSCFAEPEPTAPVEPSTHSAPATQAWAPKTAPLMTKWAAEVDPKAPLPEYPRPQMVRADWQNLNGIWQYRDGVGPVPVGQNLEREILVPYPIESALSGIMEGFRKEVAANAYYRRTFTTQSGWSGKKVLLHFGAVDWESEVYINGKSLGIHRGGYDAFQYDITPFLNGKTNELIVRIFDPGNLGYNPAGKQVTWPSGMCYTGASGIWQTVWLEAVPDTYIKDIKMVPDIDKGNLTLTVYTEGSTSGISVEAIARNGKTIVGTSTGSLNNQITIPIPKPRLWSPTDPFLYDLEIKLKNGEKTIDLVGSYFGMRKLNLGTDNGVKKLFLNNKFAFQIGPLDQGFWPDGIYTAPTDSALKWDIEKTKELGFNMIRKHTKVEPARWYYWCDKIGMMVWQDMPMRLADHPDGIPADVEKSHANFEVELDRMIETHWNYPSIVMWIIFNESNGQYDSVRLTERVLALDDSRFVNCASGNTDFEIGSVSDRHAYPAPLFTFSSTRATVNGEFGGVKYLVDNHQWQKETFGYMEVHSSDELTSVYEDFISQINKFQLVQGCSGAVYTQTTDVEGEINGLITYDRKVVKPDISRMYRAHQSTLNASDAPTPAMTTPTPLPVPSLSPDSSITKLEAENATKFGNSHNTEDPGASGGQVVESSYAVGDGIQFNNAPESTQLVLRYSSEHDGKISVYINGGVHVADLSFMATGGWSTFREASALKVNIPAGAALKFQIDKGDMALIFDCVTLSKSITP